ncbi:nuclear GTP-binding protein nug1 [Linderina macrospora]|uniref:Nuclear GTP-binding protein nug1 n=1 Tax=Linderina macrospora TaxID=4868 RepID=A0ACC1JFB7_9FUNG|nr:nuclear GTP-binding protein nug1 [Linderina macrospora]
MVPKKHKSKRVPLKQQQKIRRKASEKRRKDRREAKRNPQRTKLKKDPGIPNLFPMKDKVLSQIEEHRAQLKEEKERQRDARKSLHDKNRNLSTPASIADLAKDAQSRDEQYEDDMSDSDSDSGMKATVDGAVTGRRDNSKRAYYKEFQKVVQNADVILEVLDARDPLGTRAPQIERMIMDAGANKRIILILNKIDLVPRDVVEKWLKYLRHEFPTLAFKASTQEQRSNLGQASSNSKKAVNLSTSECVGAESLIQLLKNYSRNQKIKTSITVGAIGFPNVGKSSLINSLKRSRVCGVGSTPGFTKFVQQIHLDKNLKLLDCPGIVFNGPVKAGTKLDETAMAEMMLRNCIKVELLDDPVTPVNLIVQRCKPQALQAMYNVPAFMTTRDFLVRLAIQRGQLKRGGIADVEAAARIVLSDWNKGKIPYYTLPPGMTAKTNSGKTAAGDAAAAHGAERAVVVSEWAKEFDIGGLLGDIDSAALEGAKTDNAFSRRAVVMEGCTIAQDINMEMDAADVSSEDDEEAMSEDDEVAAAPMGTTVIELPTTKKTKALERSSGQALTGEEAAINPQLNRQLKLEQRKKQKKQAKRAQELAAAAADEMMVEEEGDGNDDYDFGAYFKQPEHTADQGAMEESDDDDL